jgi:hypothetical protein
MTTCTWTAALQLGGVAAPTPNPKPCSKPSPRSAACLFFAESLEQGSDASASCPPPPPGDQHTTCATSHNDHIPALHLSVCLSEDVFRQTDRQTRHVPGACPGRPHRVVSGQHHRNEDPIHGRQTGNQRSNSTRQIGPSAWPPVGVPTSSRKPPTAARPRLRSSSVARAKASSVAWKPGPAWPWPSLRARPPPRMSPRWTEPAGAALAALPCDRRPPLSGRFRAPPHSAQSPPAKRKRHRRSGTGSQERQEGFRS